MDCEAVDHRSHRQGTQRKGGGRMRNVIYPSRTNLHLGIESAPYNTIYHYWNPSKQIENKLTKMSVVASVH